MRGSEPLSSASGATGVREAEAEGAVGVSEEGPAVGGRQRVVAHRLPHDGQGLGRVEVVGERGPEPLSVGVDLGVLRGSPRPARAATA